MARQLRIEYAGALYHIMARGDRREPIVSDDTDYNLFLETLGEMCQRTGCVVHAYVILPNHYHLALETPEANLVGGMRWLQNTYTRRYNTRHKLWGHVFGGRYKSLLVDGGDLKYFRCLLEYIHLNPIRAGLVPPGGRLESYEWSSLKEYLSVPAWRPQWLCVERGLSVYGLTDNGSGRREYLRHLCAAYDQARPKLAGLPAVKELGLSLQNCISRGWYFGSQIFGEQLLKMSGEDLAEKQTKRADGYYGAQLQDHGELRARGILSAGLKVFGLTESELIGLRNTDYRKLLLAEAIRAETALGLDWIRSALNMGDRSYCSHLIQRQKHCLKNSPKLRAIRDKLLDITRILD